MPADLPHSADAWLSDEKGFAPVMRGLYRPPDCVALKGRLSQSPGLSRAFFAPVQGRGRQLPPRIGAGTGWVAL